MARRRKGSKRSSDPRSNHGKYTSEDRPVSSRTSSKDSTETSATNQSSTNTQAASDAKPSAPADVPGPKSPNARGVNDPEWYTKDP